MSRKSKVKSATMTFRDAIEAAESGKYIRHPEMGPGWTLGALSNIPNAIWCLNPHTGSEYAYTASDKDRKREDWYVVKNRIDQESLEKDR
jgi:hypothetical protein